MPKKFRIEKNKQLIKATNLHGTYREYIENVRVRILQRKQIFVLKSVSMQLKNFAVVVVAFPYTACTNAHVYLSIKNTPQNKQKLFTRWHVAIWEHSIQNLNLSPEI